MLAWQLTNRCRGQCLACCEESGPDRAWPTELTRAEALELAERIVAAGIPYVVFGGGEPLAVPHCWDLFERLAHGGVALKLETDGSLIDEGAAERLARLQPQCLQISLDGATASTHERLRPGSSYTATLGAIERLRARGQPPQAVFVPTRLNLHEALDTYERAARLGCSAFVTGPLMRLGRAAAHWDTLACSAEQWRQTVQTLRQRSDTLEPRIPLAIYPYDILEEMERRLERPQAMLLIVPDGRVKLLNALPFVVADLRHDSIATAWQAYRQGWRAHAVRRFIGACRNQPGLLQHANATWPLQRSPT